MSCRRGVSDLTPHFGQWAGWAGHRIRLGKEKSAHALALGLGRSAATNVPGLVRRICTNDEKIGTALQPAVPGRTALHRDLHCSPFARLGLCTIPIPLCARERFGLYFF